MKVTVEKVDDINFILSGTVKNSTIEEKVAKETKQNASKDENATQDAAAKIFKEFVDAGIKEANIDVANILGQPMLKKHEQREDSIYFEVELSISPEIDVNTDYTDIIPPFVKPIAEPKEVEAKLLEYATQQAPFSKIEKERATNFPLIIKSRPPSGRVVPKTSLNASLDRSSYANL